MGTTLNRHDELAREVAEKIADSAHVMITTPNHRNYVIADFTAIVLPYLADEKGVWEKAVAIASHTQSQCLKHADNAELDANTRSGWHTQSAGAWRVKAALEAARDRSRSGEQGRIDSNTDVQPHAVRWSLRPVGLEERFSKWHGTRNALTTFCGHVIPVGQEFAFLPETDDDLTTVDCRQCLNRRKNNE